MKELSLSRIGVNKQRQKLMELLMSLLKTKAQHKLFEKWNKKLEKFDDCNAEDFRNFPEDPPLHSWHNFKFKKLTKDEYDETIKYFDKAKEILNSYKFRSAWHRKIWALHSEGLSGEEISQRIKGSFKKTRINEILKCIRKEAGLE
jgi:hypothetical protein